MVSGGVHCNRSSKISDRVGQFGEIRMKILQINSHYDRGGAARIAACIHRQLLAEGEESYVAYGRGEDPHEKNVFCIDKKYEVWISAMLCRLAGLNGWFNRRATLRLVRKIGEIRPDVVHIHALHGYYINFKILFDCLNREKIPCVWTFHDCHAFVGNCGYFFSCENWKSGCSHCPDIRRYPKSEFFDFNHYMWKKKKEWFGAHPHLIVATPSDWLTDAAKASFFGKFECVTIRNGIDARHTFYPRGRERCRKKYGYRPDEKIVLGIAAGYKDERKGAKYMLGLARMLESEARMILIGWDSENDAMLFGHSNITALPHTESVDMLAEYYSLADVFVLSSLAENYATVTLESMACGTPVVGFDAGGTKEQLSDHKGIAVEAGNQKALLLAVRTAFLPESGLLRGDALAEKIREENSVERMTDAYKKLYRKLVSVK